MRRLSGTSLSGVMHAALIALAIFGLPWFSPRESPPVQVTDVSFVSEADFEAAQSAADARAERAEEAPPVPAAPAQPQAPQEPAPEPEPEPEPEAEAPTEEEVATLAPGFDANAPLGLGTPSNQPDAPARDAAPSIVVPAPLSAIAPPRARPSLRIDPTPAPPPPEEARPAESVTPETAPAPEAEAPQPDRPPEAPPEAAPEPAAEPPPPETVALQSSSPPLARRGNLRARPPAPEPEPETEPETAAELAAATPPTPPTAPTQTQPTAPAVTSLPVGPPLTSGEKDGLKFAIQQCWRVPAGVRDAQDLKITVGAELDPNGAVLDGSVRLISPASLPDTRYDAAYRAARIALVRCSPYTAMPRAKYAQWRSIEVVFNPEGMVSW